MMPEVGLPLISNSSSWWRWRCNGVGVVGAVAEDEAVARALLEDELVFVGVGLSVDEEGVEFACSAGDLFEDHVDDGRVGG